MGLRGYIHWFILCCLQNMTELFKLSMQFHIIPWGFNCKSNTKYQIIYTIRKYSFKILPVLLKKYFVISPNQENEVPLCYSTTSNECCQFLRWRMARITVRYADHQQHTNPKGFWRSLSAKINLCPQGMGVKRVLSPSGPRHFSGFLVWCCSQLKANTRVNSMACTGASVLLKLRTWLKSTVHSQGRAQRMCALFCAAESGVKLIWESQFWGWARQIFAHMQVPVYVVCVLRHGGSSGKQLAGCHLRVHRGQQGWWFV